MNILVIFLAGLLAIQAATVPLNVTHTVSTQVLAGKQDNVEVPAVVVEVTKDNKVVGQAVPTPVPNVVDVVMPTKLPLPVTTKPTAKVTVKPGLSIIPPTLPTVVVDHVVKQRSVDDDNHWAGVHWGDDDDWDNKNDNGKDAGHNANWNLKGNKHGMHKRSSDWNDHGNW
uniref:Uncharacterized protein n=1 Tax=Musca domestica TaxID=7370 RepID=A0A1I8NL15_MUSDO